MASSVAVPKIFSLQREKTKIGVHPRSFYMMIVDLKWKLIFEPTVHYLRVILRLQNI